MIEYETGKIVWFIKLCENDTIHCLGFITSNTGGAYIVGGPTGSHFTGHGES